MRFTVGLFQSVPSNAQYFEQLPQILKNFFNKHLPATHVEYSKKPTLTSDPTANPFLPNKHPVTQKYHAPQYSLRRQSVLFKTAKQYGIENLLPSLNKLFYEEKYNNKKFMKGVLRPKGHKHELTKQAREQKIEQALEKMDEKILSVKGKKFQKRLEKKQQKTWF